MNEFEPKKDDSLGQDTAHDGRAPGQDTPSSSDAEGREYTNPDGSHGYVYNARVVEAENRTRRYRGALIAVSATFGALLFAFACVGGAMMAARTIHGIGDALDAGWSMFENVETTDGLFIAEDGVPALPAESVTGLDGTPEADGEKTPGSESAATDVAVTVPDKATIEKLPAKRQDADKDGRPDIAYDENGSVLTSAGETVLSVATVVDRVAASVVEITTETRAQSGYLGQYITSGAGSGVIIAQEGYIVTNHHVIDGANTITVRLNDGTEYPATLVGSDAETDVAVLWIDAGGRALTVATLGASYDLVVGEDILAIGNPLGSLGGTVTEGMISATAREITVNGSNMTLLQVSAPINPGNSGGGLFNLAGELVGVVNAKMSSEEIEGLGFAIPSDTAYDVVCELIAYGYVRGRPALGVTLTEVSSWNGKRYVRVSGRNHDMLQYQDLILEVDGTAVSSITELAAAVRRKSVGDTVELTVYRNERQMVITVPVVEQRPAD